MTTTAAATTAAATSASPAPVNLDPTPVPGTRRVGVMLPRDLPAGEVLTFARRADELGFDELWVVEDLGFRGGIAQASAILAVTPRITVGIGIMSAAARQAAFAAMEVATLGQLFPGRVIAGVGHGMPGWMRSLGVWPASPLTLLGEFTTAVRSILRGQPVPAGGRYVSVGHEEFTELPDVVPPLVLGVRGPKSLALSGRVADGTLLAEPAPPTYIRAALGHIAAEGPHDLITYDVAMVGDDAEAALDVVRPGLAWIGEPDWAPHLVGLDFAAELATFRAAAAGPEEFAATMPAAWVDALTLAGTPEQVRAKIAARHDAGATCVVLTPVGAGRSAQLEQLARVL